MCKCRFIDREGGISHVKSFRFGGGVFDEEKDFQLYVAQGTYEQVTNWINN